jgi:hypothetical protein
MYENYATYAKKMLDASSTQIKVTQGPSAGSSNSNLIYVDNTFEITLDMKVDGFINSKDHIIVFNYPSSAVKAPTTVESSDNTADEPLKGKIKETLSLKAFGTDGVSLEGLEEELIPGRMFKITLGGFKALDNLIDVSQNLTIRVYYKNTYSIISQVEKSIITVKPAIITLSAAHPESWDIYQGGAWPIKFTYKSNNDFANGGWIKIQHSNAIKQSATNGNLLSFITSTCDFSSGDTDNSFGKRPSCYPLQNDLDYRTSTSAAYSGSGFFFKVNSITKNTDYNLTIWAFADACGNLATTAVPVANIEKENLNWVKPKFTFNMYKTIETDKLGDARLKASTGVNSIVAKDSEAIFGGKCWKGLSFVGVDSGATSVTKGFAKIQEAQIAAIVNYKTNVLISYNEITVWDTYSYTDLAATINSTFTIDGTYANTARYLFPKDSTTKLADESYFLIQFRIIKGDNTTDLYYNSVLNLPSKSSSTNLSGRLIFQFSKNWFKAGDAYDGASRKCWVSWGVNKSPEKPSTIQSFAAALEKFICASTTTADNSIDVSKTNLSDSTKIFRIVSTYNLDSSGDGFTLAENADVKNSALKLKNAVLFGGIASSCVKWKNSSQRPAITSLYSYIDIQVQATYLGAASNDLGTVLSVWRFIKLFPEQGVFQDKSFSKVHSSADKNSYFINHFAYTTISGGVCLLEFDGAELKDQKGSTGNTLSIWLFGATLLETDYNDVSALYPAAPLATGIKTYGLSSAPILDNNSALATTNDKYTPIIRTLSILGSFESTALSAKAIPTNGASDPAVSNYLFFMGSQVLFTGVGSTLTESTETNLFVPYYCPRYIKNIDGDESSSNTLSIKIMGFYPTAIAAWLDMTSYKDITKLSSTVTSFKNSSYNMAVQTTSKVNEKIRVITSANSPEGKTVTSAQNSYQMTLRWSPYTTSDADAKLFVYNGTTSATGTDNLKASGYTLFLKSQINFDSTNPVSFNSGKITKQYTGTTNFYVFGKPFQKGVFSGLITATNTAVAQGGTATITKQQVSDGSDSTSYYTNITRPTIESFVDSKNNFSTNDYLAFFCSSANEKLNFIATNYVTESSTSSFLLDIYSKIGDDFTSPSITADISEIFQSDPAGNFKTVVNPPKSVPKGSNLVIASSVLGSNSICALINGTSTIADCSNSSGTISCPVLALGSSFTICCYNIKIEATITLSSAKVNLPVNSTFSSHVTQTIYSATTQIAASPNAFTYTTNNTSLNAVGSAKLNKIVYSHVNQESGYGKATLEITLPRQPTRDMRLDISGSLSAMKIGSESPRCVASFSEGGLIGKNWGTGDILIDICSVSKFETSPPVVVTTKKMIYKCGQTFQKTLYIDLWPIKVYNFNATGANKSFTVTMKTNSGDAIAKNDVAADLSMANVSAAVQKTQAETLCPVTKVSPSVPGVPADYTFTFDLETNKSALEGTTADEVSIFFPYRYYGAFVKNIICMKGNDILNCTFSNEGILNIRVALTAGSKEAITLVGIPNPYIASDISFVCTVNNTNVSTNVRTNIITGSGKLSGGINTTGVTQSGALRFLSVTEKVTNNSIRNTSTTTFRVAFDNAIAITATGKITVSNSPCLYIYLPAQYMLAYYAGTVPSVEISQYSKDTNNKITVNSTPVSIKTVNVVGNKIAVELTATSYEFDENFMYWDVKVSNLINPPQVTALNGPPVTMTTCMYNVMLANSDNTALYRTFSNLNTYSSSKLTTQIDSNLAYNRGNAFVIDTNKYLIDIFADANQLNMLTIKAGRYLKSYMKFRKNTNYKIRSALTAITLNNYSSFKMLENEGIVLATAFNESISFWLGCPCNTALGRYMVNFTSKETLAAGETNIIGALSPVIITVDTSTKGTLNYSATTNIPGAGSTIIKMLLSEPNFEAISLKFTAQENITNDKSAKIDDIKIPEKSITSGKTARMIYTTFSITDENILNEQKYEITQDNACYEWNDKSLKKKISFVIDQKTAIIPEKIDLTTYFVYTNSVTETSLDKNSMKFKFTAPAAPIYLYCALVCSDKTMPSLDVIKENTKSNVNKNTATEKFYFNMVANKETPIDFTFSNLARGLNYKMNCTIESTQGDITKRTKSTSYVYNNNVNKTSTFISPKTTSYTCARWNFANNPGDLPKQEIVNYCQVLYSETGYFSSGCVVCADSEGKYVSKGLTLTKDVSCVTATKTRRLRFLENSEVNDASYFTVCATPNPVCETDSKYTEVFTKFKDSLKTNNDFVKIFDRTNVFLNETNPVTVISDDNEPSIEGMSLSIKESNVKEGSIKFEVSNPTPLKCVYKIQTGSTPSFNEIKACTDKSRCGTVRVGPSKRTFELQEKTPFTAGTWAMYLSCQNDISNAVKFTTIKKIDIPVDLPIENSPTTPTNSTVDPNTSSGFVRYSMIGLMMIVALLF